MSKITDVKYNGPIRMKTYDVLSTGPIKVGNKRSWLSRKFLRAPGEMDRPFLEHLKYRERRCETSHSHVAT